MGNEVLESTRFLVEEPKYVFINREKLEETAKKFADEKLEMPDWHMPVFLEGNSKEVIDFFFLGNTINFCYDDFRRSRDKKIKFEASYNGAPYKGATGMWACLKKAYEGDFPELLDGDFLSDISKFEMEKIFEGNIRIPLFDERLNIFREVGQVLCENYDGHFYNLVEDSDNRLFNDGEGLVERLTSEFPSFDDSAHYDGKLVIFDKRAQLAPAMTYGRFRGEGLMAMEDIDELTVFADYVLPKGLRGLGILTYDKSLADKVDNSIEIPRHSREELEIRASTIHACKMLIDRINEIKGPGSINALHVDYKLWGATRKLPGEHHLTYSTDY
ncbi:hypothetical protein JXB28_02995 [Candidatus Woesearchaeota archaeon]|nr:hypothetical protein [Candidatus Woesearchaeota archaeon]